MSDRFLLLVLVLAVAGCASAAPDPLAVKLTEHYARHATEEDGRCASPEIASVTKRKVLARSADRTVLRVRYSYFDPGAGSAIDWDRVLHSDRPCTGFAERDFTLAATDAGYRVIEMSGSRRIEEP